MILDSVDACFGRLLYVSLPRVAVFFLGENTQWIYAAFKGSYLLVMFYICVLCAKLLRHVSKKI